MAAKKSNDTCESCGSKGKRLVKHYLKNVCSMCQAARAVARNNPAVVISALKEFGNMPVAETESSLLEEISRLKSELAEYVGIVQEYREMKKPDAEGNDTVPLTAHADPQAAAVRIGELERFIGTLQSEVAVELGYDSAVDFSIATEVSILKQENNRLREQLAEASAELDAATLIGRHEQPADSARAAVILDIVMDTMAGKITGLDVNRLRELR